MLTCRGRSMERGVRRSDIVVTAVGSRFRLDP